MLNDYFIIIIIARRLLDDVDEVGFRRVEEGLGGKKGVLVMVDRVVDGS